MCVTPYYKPRKTYVIKVFRILDFSAALGHVTAAG